MNRMFRLGSALSLVFICRAQQPPASPADTAIVHIRVNSDYDDSPASLKMIETLARYVPSVEAQVGPEDNFDSVFVRQYGFGSSPPPKGLPKSYALLKQIILAKNNLKGVNDLKRPGVLAVPALPKWAWTGWGRLNLYNYLANMVVFPAASAVPAASSSNREPTSPAASISESHPSEIAYRVSTAVDTLRLKAPFTVLSFELGIRQAVELVQSKVVPAADKGIDASRLPVKLAEDNKCDTEPDAKDHPTLIPDQRARISQLMNQFSQRSPVVFILDTGWPRSAYKESFTTLYQILDAVWTRRFGKSYSDFFHGAPAPQADIDEAGNGHCRCILRALKELNNLDKDLDPAKRVRVVYVPLTREQGAAGVITDLVLTGILFERQASQQAKITTEIVNESRNLASQQVLDRFPEKWVGDEVQTDKSVLDAILRIGQIYAEVTDTVFFVNESWTVRHPDIDGQYSVKYQNPQYGVVTAAAGNTNGGTSLLDFAQRSAGSADTMAIIDMTANGPAPTSTLLAPNLIDMSLAAGFDGLVTDDIPGTSFAAPRIAWFLAAGEAVRKAPLVLKLWDPALPFVLRSLRDNAATGYGKLLFDPIRYIEFQAGLNAQAPRHTDPPPLD